MPACLLACLPERCLTTHSLLANPLAEDLDAGTVFSNTLFEGKK